MRGKTLAFPVFGLELKVQLFLRLESDGFETGKELYLRALSDTYGVY